MATKIGIVYGTVSGIIRRVIVPDDDSQLDDLRHIGIGESIVKVDKSAINGPADVDAVVQGILGFPPRSPRCAVVNMNGIIVGGGEVVNVICADPLIDSISNRTLVSSTVAKVGWTWHPIAGFAESISAESI